MGTVPEKRLSNQTPGGGVAYRHRERQLPCRQDTVAEVSPTRRAIQATAEIVRPAGGPTNRREKMSKEIGKYVVIQDHRTSPEDTFGGDVYGPFDSLEEADHFMKSDAQNCIDLDGLHEGTNREWGSVQYICKVVGKKKVVPVVTIKYKMENQR